MALHVELRKPGNGQEPLFTTEYPGVVTAGAAATGGGVTWTDKTITSATGSSQTMIAANAARKGMVIKNGAANTGVNVLGTTAAIGGAATITLAPYEGLTVVGLECPLTAITIITTAANYVSAFEMT